MQSSSGVNETRGTSLSARLIQYLQLNMHSLVYRTFSKDIHRPSAAKLWHIPLAHVEPILPFSAFLSTPLDVHATSYLAESASIFNFSSIEAFSSITITQSPVRNICSVKYNTACMNMQEVLYNKKFILHFLQAHFPFACVGTFNLRAQITELVIKKCI